MNKGKRKLRIRTYTNQLLKIVMKNVLCIAWLGWRWRYWPIRFLGKHVPDEHLFFSYFEGLCVQTVKQMLMQMNHLIHSLKSKLQTWKIQVFARSFHLVFKARKTIMRLTNQKNVGWFCRFYTRWQRRLMKKALRKLYSLIPQPIFLSIPLTYSTQFSLHFLKPVS